MTRTARHEHTRRPIVFRVALANGDAIDARHELHGHCTNHVGGRVAAAHRGSAHERCDCGGSCVCHLLIDLGARGATVVEMLRAQQAYDRGAEHEIHCPACKRLLSECVCPCPHCLDTGRTADDQVCACSCCPECGTDDARRPLKVYPPCRTCHRARTTLAREAERAAGWDATP